MHFRKLLNKLLRAFRITRQPVIRAYDGYGDEDDVVIYGHVLSLSPLERRKYRQNFLINTFAMIRLFMVRPRRNARVILEWNGETHETTTDKQGFFKFEWKPLRRPEPGWHTAKLSYVRARPAAFVVASTSCDVFIPHIYQYSFISDIDDTFLISHSGNLLKRLRVLFLKNARSRVPFEGVVRHYQLLARSGTNTTEHNPFFYVSSSEWNLYSYIREFCRQQELPRGVFLLSSMKRLTQLLQTGQGKHATKYVRIARIMKSYPGQKYVLLGDNTQKDPEIYAAITRDFPGKIYAVYIREISRRNAPATKAFMQRITSLGVHCCLFTNSADAIRHSQKIGLIDPDSVDVPPGEL